MTRISMFLILQQYRISIMQNIRQLVIVSAISCMLLLTGCAAEMKDLRIKEDVQRSRISQLESELKTAKLQLDQANRELAQLKAKESVVVESLNKKINILTVELEAQSKKVEVLNKALREKQDLGH